MRFILVAKSYAVCMIYLIRYLQVRRIYATFVSAYMMQKLIRRQCHTINHLISDAMGTSRLAIQDE